MIVTSLFSCHSINFMVLCYGIPQMRLYPSSSLQAALQTRGRVVVVAGLVAGLVARLAAMVALALGRRRLALAALAVALVVVGRGGRAGLGARRVARAALRRRLYGRLAGPDNTTLISDTKTVSRYSLLLTKS